MIALGLSPSALAEPASPVRAPLVPVCIRTVSHACGLVDREGNWKVRPQYSEIRQNGSGWTIEKESGLTGWLTTNGEVGVKPQFESIGGFADGLAPARLHGEDTKYGYIDSSGRWVIQPRFDSAVEFSEGLAGVAWTEGQDERFGYVDLRGQVVFRTPERADEPFEDGRTTLSSRPSNDAPITCRGLDRKGREVVRTTGKNNCTAAPVLGGGWILASDNTSRLVDRKLRTLFKVQGDEAYIHDDLDGSPVTGLGVFSSGSGDGLINLRTGRVLIAARKGLSLGVPGEGLVSYEQEKNGEWVRGFLDYSGRPVVPARYATSDQFRYGRALVTLPSADPAAEGTPVVLNLQGQELPRFKAMRPVSIELAPWEDSAENPVRRDVAKVITAQNEEVWTDLDGVPFLWVRGSKRCDIQEVFNRKGQQVWPTDSAAVCRINDAEPPQYDDMSAAEDPLLAQAHASEVDRLDDEALLQAQGEMPVIERMRSPEQRQMEKMVRDAPWLDGPREIPLSEGAQLSLPAGHRYLPPEAVLNIKRLMREGAESEAPEVTDGQPLVSTGWLQGPNDHWRTEVSVVQPGYVKLDVTLPGAEGLLRTMRPFNAGDPTDEVADSGLQVMNWLRTPQVDQEQARLEYAYSDGLLGSGRQDILHMALFGRREVVVLSTAWSSPMQSQHFELFQADVRKLGGHIQFLPGHRHQDYREGDIVAPVALETLITGPESESVTRMGQGVVRMEQERQARINGKLLGMFLVLIIFALGLTAGVRRQS